MGKDVLGDFLILPYQHIFGTYQRNQLALCQTFCYVKTSHTNRTLQGFLWRGPTLQIIVPKKIGMQYVHTSPLRRQCYTPVSYQSGELGDKR